MKVGEVIIIKAHRNHSKWVKCVVQSYSESYAGFNFNIVGMKGQTRNERMIKRLKAL